MDRLSVLRRKIVRIGVMSAILVSALASTLAASASAEEPQQSVKALGAFGSGGSGPGQFSTPWGIATSPEGDVYVADSGNNRIEEFNAEGTQLLTQWGSAGEGNSQFWFPEGVAVNAQGEVYVTDTLNNRVQWFTAGGSFKGKFGRLGSHEGQLFNPEGLAVDAHGNVWVSDRANSRVEEYNSQGAIERAVGTAGSGEGQLSYPGDVGVDSEGNIWVADTGNQRIEEFRPQGTFDRAFGSEGSQIGRFNNPWFLTIGPENTIWVADTGNNRVQVFSPTGNFMFQFGTKGSGPSQFNAPDSIAIHEHAVYVLDRGNARVDRWQFEGLPPSNLVPPEVTGSAQVGVTLFATTGTWVGSGPPSYAYRWQRCGTTGCEAINGAAGEGSSHLLTEEDRGKTLRVVVTASNHWGSLAVTSAASPVISARGAGPFATVYNSAGQPVAQWGAAYGAEPGTQIQLAENFAECGNEHECTNVNPEGPALYPKVGLEPGVYQLQAVYGLKHPASNKCEGIFAYAAVKLEGSPSGTNIVDEDHELFPCGREFDGKEQTPRLTSAVFVSATPANINLQGHTLNVSYLQFSTTPAQGCCEMERGLFAWNLEGPGLSVSHIKVSGPAYAAGMQIGEGGSVNGTPSSPVQVVENEVEGVHEGIVLGGTNMHVWNNYLHNNKTDGIATYGPTSRHTEIVENTVTFSPYGITLDGSFPRAAGNTTESVGHENLILYNHVREVCEAIRIYRQQDAWVAHNEITVPGVEWATEPTQMCYGDRSGTKGVYIHSASVNYFWKNIIANFAEAYYIDGASGSTDSPEGKGTIANYIGRVPDYGHEWPWPVEGSYILNALSAFEAVNVPANTNEYVGNEEVDTRGPICNFGPGTEQLHSANSPEC
jgi:sugar lactone lactonase YvrE